MALGQPPEPTPRQDPLGSFSYDEGYPLTITFGLRPDIQFWEVDVKPPGLMVGKEINKTSQLNKLVKTKALPRLPEWSECEGTVQFNLASYSQAYAIIGKNQQITITFPDGWMLCFWGGLQEFSPDNESGEKMPQAKIKICVTNQDISKQESPPVLYNPAGALVLMGTI